MALLGIGIEMALLEGHSVDTQMCRPTQHEKFGPANPETDFPAGLVGQSSAGNIFSGADQSHAIQPRSQTNKLIMLPMIPNISPYYPPPPPSIFSIIFLTKFCPTRRLVIISKSSTKRVYQYQFSNRDANLFK